MKREQNSRSPPHDRLKPIRYLLRLVTTPASSRVLPPLSTCPDPLRRGVPIRFQEKFFPLGTVVQVESNDEAVIRASRRSFGLYGAPPAASDPEILIQICVDPDRHDDRPLPVPTYRSLRHIFHIACSDTNFAVADLASGCAVGFVSPEMVGNASFFCYTFLECLFYVMVVHRSHTPVHCSSVALNGSGILICGAAGAGKTTLAYACAKSGMQILTDDVAHLRLDPTSDRLLLWGNPWCLRLLPDAVQLFPELADEKVTQRRDHDWYLEIDTLRRFPGRTLASCRPAGLVFLVRQEGVPTRLSPMRREIALERLREDITLDEDAIIERHYSVLDQLVGTGTYTLKYSGAPSAAVEVIKSLLHKELRR